jgi:RNA polymerase sigma-70 factor, ECF subfamily
MFEATYDAVLAYARRRAPNADLAEEVVSETFATAWRRFDDVPEDALPWLYGVARRVFANQARSYRRRLALFGKLASQPASSEMPRDPGELVSDRDMLLRSLALLREEDREVLLLASWEGLEPVRAAQSLGISTDAFTARLHRARRRLAEAIDRGEPRRVPDDPEGRA